MKAILFVVHSLFAIQFFYGCYYDYNYVHVPKTTLASSGGYGGKFKFLTFLNAMLQTLYFVVAALNDIIGTNDPAPSKKPIIRKFKDILFATLAFPLAMFVGASFWSLYAVDRELVFPKAIDEFFPVWLNHLMHTSIVACILIELLACFRLYPKRKSGLSVLSVFLLMYVIWVHVVYYKSGQWVYPVLQVLNWPQRVGFFIFNLVLSVVFYILGEKLNHWVWHKQILQIQRASKKKPH